MNKPFAESCLQNREPILTVLKTRLEKSRKLLEIGSGTGQHAVYFAGALDHLTWQTSDRVENHPGISMWLDEARLTNTLQPIPLDVESDPWPTAPYDAVFTANTAHIMDHQAVAAMFSGAGTLLTANGLFLIYGPFNYNGSYTSESNRQFDLWLKQRDPESGIKELEWLQSLAADSGLSLQEDIPMPANNRILVWQKST